MANVREIQETNLGLYAWEVDGKLIGDDEGHFLTVPSVQGDVKKISALRNVAYSFLKDIGEEPRGRAVFLPGRRQVTDEEYEEQVQRAKWGLVPDPLDVPAMKEEAEYNKRFNQ